MRAARFLIVLLIATSSPWTAPCAADDPRGSFAAPLNDASTPLLKEILSRLSGRPVHRAKFKQTKMIAGLTKPVVTSGEFLFARGKGVAWRMKDPFPITYVVTPNAIWERDDETGASTRLEVRDHPGLRSFTEVFLALFETDEQALARLFALYLSGGRDRWGLGLIPRGHSVRNFLREVTIRGSVHVDSVVVVEASGDTMEVAFTETVTEPESLSPEEAGLFR